MTLPAQATLGIFTFLHAWNDYWWPLVSGTNAQMYTMTVGIASTQVNFAESAGLGYLMAQAVFGSLPHAGKAKSIELMVTGRTFSFEEAESMGLVNMVLPKDDWWESVLLYARQFCTPNKAAMATDCHGFLRT